jgi:peroxin-1
MRGIIVIATAQSQAAIHPLLKTLHVFGEIINVLPPNKNARRDVSNPPVCIPEYISLTYTKILATFVASRLDASDINMDDTLNFSALATQTEGYAAMDLEDLVARAVHQAAIRAAQISHPGDVRVSVSLLNLTLGVLNIWQPTLRAEDFASAQADFVPHSLRDVQLQKSDVAWSDIGGKHLCAYIFVWTSSNLLLVIQRLTWHA